jgi:glycosyltransferase involved in cell wall biosynthesis
VSSSAIIIIPCYNESQRLPADDFKAFARNHSGQKFLFVNDGSTDDTLTILKDLRDFAPEQFAICDLPSNVGKGEAVRTGILRGYDSAPDYMGYWDADLATPLEVILTFCELLDSRPEIEMVFGARVRLLGRDIERRALRHYPGRIFATAASLVLGLTIYDTQCGAKLFRASSNLRPLFQEPFLSRWLFDIEIVARLIQARRGTELPQPKNVIYEFPLQIWHDVPDSKVKAWDFGKAFVGLGRIYWYYFFKDRWPATVERAYRRKKDLDHLTRE